MWLVWLPLLALTFFLFTAGCVLVAREVCSNWGALTKRQRLHTLFVFFCISVFIGGVANLFVFMTVDVAIGGDAIAGKIENERYYVAYRGRLTEVSRDVWVYSYYHTKSTWITHPLAFLAGLGMILSKRVFGLEEKPLTITLTRDGYIVVEGKETTINEAVTQAESKKSRAGAIHIKQGYPPETVPANAVKLYYELINRGILFETIDGPVN